MKKRPVLKVVKLICPILILALAGWFFLSQTFIPALSQQTHGFAAYYTGAWLLVQGRASSLYEPIAFNQAMQESGIVGIYDIYDANAPLLTALTWPLGLMPPQTARVVWLWLNLGLMLLLLFPAYRLGRRRGLWPFCLTAAFLLFYAPLRENFRLGQMYLPFLLAMALALTFSNSLNQTIALAVQLVLKLYYGFFGLVAGLPRLKTLVTAVTITFGLALLLLPWLGPTLWLDYLRLATGFSERPETAVTAYQTLNGLFNHLFRYDSRWNPQPLANLPWLARLLSLLVSSVLVMSTLYFSWKTLRNKPGPKQLQLNAALVLTLAPLIAPVAEEYHYTLLALPLIIGLSSEQWNLEAARRFALWIGAWSLAFLLLMLPWAYKSWAATGWLALGAYPRLYGGLLLWVLLIRSIRIERMAQITLTFGQNINHRD